MRVERDLLRLLGDAPFLDRLEMAALSGWSRGGVYAVTQKLEEAGLTAPLPHASELLAPTQRYHLTYAGMRRLAAEEGVATGDLLRSRPLTAHWRRLLLERLDGVAVIYRLAAAIADDSWPLRFRWYRAAPMDAAIGLPDGRTLFVVRQGQTADRTAFAKRLWRLREEPCPGAYLLLASDAVRLRHTVRQMALAPAPAFLSLERDAAVSGPGARAWRSAAGSPPLALTEVLSHVAAAGAWPDEEPPARVVVPRALPGGSHPKPPDWLLPILLKPAEKRTLGLLGDWPWIATSPICTLLGSPRSSLAGTLSRLRRRGLVLDRTIRGRRLLALSDRGVALLARRDRASVGVARRRWSAELRNPDAPFTWRHVVGSRSRQLLRNLDHSASVHAFIAALAAQARADGLEVVQLDPPRRASRYFPHHERLHSVQPDAFATLRGDGRSRSFFIEWERRALHPATMAARLAPYLRYYATQRPTDDHGLRPTALVVFEDELAAHHFLRVASEEIARASIDLPLLVSSASALREAGPLGESWRAPSSPLRSRRLLAVGVDNLERGSGP